MPPLSLVTVLSELPDPRHRQGKIHPLPAVLSLVVLGLLMGRKSLSSLARLGRQYGVPLAHALGFRRGKTPSKSTLSEILRALDADRLEALFSRWVCSRIGHVKTLVIEGRTLRGSRNGEVPGQHAKAFSVLPCSLINSLKNGSFSYVNVVTPPGVTTFTRIPVSASAHLMATADASGLTGRASSTICHGETDRLRAPCSGVISNLGETSTFSN